MFELGESFARDVPELAVAWNAAVTPSPGMVALNRQLAIDLGVDPDDCHTPTGVAALTGAVACGAAPVALAYAGHQFGGYSPRLGDGRALLLGEVVNAQGGRCDIHLKGSGRTPFSRGGDGKAALGPMLREFLISEAMAALGVPTTRSLAVVSTGERIRRDGLVPGAVLVRVASSHIRVGTFQYAAHLDDPSVLRRLADHTIERHHPHVREADNPHLGLLEAVVEAQASLVAGWMSIGFIHGVVNTDNVTVSGETIDYGPCAFMDAYDPQTVFSSIDHGGRYAFGNQPSVMYWNLARFAETLLPLIDPDPDTAIEAATEVLVEYPDLHRRHWERRVGAKIGLVTPGPSDTKLADDLLGLFAERRVDFTGGFRALGAAAAGDEHTFRGLVGESEALGRWLGVWRARLDLQGIDRSAVAAAMDRVNPTFIPRNHLVDQALIAAEGGDLDQFEALLAAVTDPYRRPEGTERRFAEPAPEAFNRGFQTFCGT